MFTNSTLEKLEYFKVLEQITRFAHSELAKEKILSIRPLQEIENIQKSGNLINEAKSLLIINIYPPEEFEVNLLESLAHSRISGNILSVRRIREIGNLLITSRRYLNYLSQNQNNAPNLKNQFWEFLFVDKNLENRIDSIIDVTNEVKSSASPKLREIRKSITDKEIALKKVVERKLKALNSESMLQEDFLTIYDGRYVFPVKAEYKRQINGLIHSESSTGQTVYIEPTEILESNNELISLRFEEKREIDRILRQLTEQIGQSSKYLQMSLETLVEIESIFASAKYSLEIDGCFPQIDKDKPLKLIRSFHPILLRRLKENTIPLNLDFKKNNILLITGPNAGGKTVVLKTVALLSLLVQSGLHVPTSSDSHFYLFDNIMVDIGDEQSIEDNLSTFSSHLANIKKILEQADSQSLILLDEIGTGTDPNEGSALASAILLELSRKNSKVIASTHQSNLKILANYSEKFENASLEFDVEKIEPTFILKQGEPGASYAFEVAKRIGLSNHIIEEAKEYVSENKKQVEELLVKLQKQSNELKEKLQSAEKENSRLLGLTSLYEKQSNEIKKKKTDIFAQARKEAQNLVFEANKKIENAIKQIRESNGDKDVISQSRKIVTEIKESITKIEKAEVGKESNFKSNKLSVGDFVKLIEGNTIGKISEIDEKKRKLSIISGNFKISVKIDEVEKVNHKEEKNLYHKNDYHSTLNSLVLDIRGKKPEEVEFEIIRFLDDAFASNIKQVEILHGKGAGVLKATVHQLLKNHEFVESFQFAKIEFGGEGITVVNLG